jgi:hypothetical protein
MSVRIAKCTTLGAIAAAALIAATPQTATAAPYLIDTNPTAGYSITVVRNGATETGVSAGPFSIDNTDDTAAAFIAWCFDLDGGVSDGQTYQYSMTNFLTTDQRGRVQQLFDANYDSDIETNLPDTAAFQIAIWDVIYDSDFNITGEAVAGAGFKVTSASPITSPTTILTKAQEFLDAAFLDDTTTDKWIITELKADESTVQNLGFATIPLPAAAWLLLGVSGALVAAKRRSSARKDA